MDIALIKTLLKPYESKVDFVSIRYNHQINNYINVLGGVVQPIQEHHDAGLMLCVYDKGASGYAATSNLSQEGVKDAFETALSWAKFARGHCLFDASKVKMPPANGSYHSDIKQSWDAVSINEKIDKLQSWNQQLKSSPQIVNWGASLWSVRNRQILLASNGLELEQSFEFLMPYIEVSAHKKGETITRTLNGRGFARQQGLEALQDIDDDACLNLSEEAIALLSAPNCPDKHCSLLLDPDQMILQIHESIGHPLELDRILGDERNYAGTSFVTLDMFGKYQYGSSLLNVSFDPSSSVEFASYAYDDDGCKAEKQLLIENGILKRPLGGLLSGHRSGKPYLANSRSSSWNRPQIDRMANINLEPGHSSLEDMISSIDEGVYMKTNSSWSIDDARNKFQFGCEWGQLIKSGKLAGLVKKPNYRGISASFWKNLSMVGHAQSREALGSPFCGKGEPNQLIRVGHSSPPCLFSNVNVFGGM